MDLPSGSQFLLSQWLWVRMLLECCRPVACWSTRLVLDSGQDHDPSSETVVEFLSAGLAGRHFLLPAAVSFFIDSLPDKEGRTICTCLGVIWVITFGAIKFVRIWSVFATYGTCCQCSLVWNAEQASTGTLRKVLSKGAKELLKCSGGHFLFHWRSHANAAFQM